jgi:TatD DNase family protein
MLFDTHCHLDTPSFDDDRDEVFARARANGVTRFLNPAYDLISSRRAAVLAQARDDTVCAVGIHPNDIGSLNDECLSELRQLAESSEQRNKVVAIGEIGLDYHWDKFSRPQQRDGFVRQIALAQEFGLPVIIHCRDAAKPAGAYADCLEILAEAAEAPTPDPSPANRNSQERGGRTPLSRSDGRGVGGEGFRVLLHSFAGSPAEARFAFERGWYIGVGGPITYKKAHELREIVKRAPLEQIVLETDAPYLSPEPHRGRRNEPAHVRLVAEQVAELRGLSIDEIAHTTFTNAQRLFGLAR